MSGIIKFARSSLGAKVVMAVTGLLMYGWLVMHMLGNLQMFAGPAKMNGYAFFMKNTMGNILWLMRFGTLGIIVLHNWSAVRLSSMNAAARPVRYVHEPSYSASTYASRTMIWSGLIIAVFLVYHIMHFTVGIAHPEHFKHLTPQGHHDAYRMVVSGFSNIMISGFYILAQLLLASHAAHGLSSLFQSLGVNSKKYSTTIKMLGPAISYAIFLGFIAVPVGVLVGIIR
jgi:succinate dehydrogenase / fumarate reductase cytochrome b subunit